MLLAAVTCPARIGKWVCLAVKLNQEHHAGLGGDGKVAE